MVMLWLNAVTEIMDAVLKISEVNILITKPNVNINWFSVSFNVAYKSCS